MKMMDFVLNIMDFVFQMMNVVLGGGRAQDLNRGGDVRICPPEEHHRALLLRSCAPRLGEGSNFH